MFRFILCETLRAIADAIRKKTGRSGNIPVEEFASAIDSISGGGGDTPADPIVVVPTYTFGVTVGETFSLDFDTSIIGDTSNMDIYMSVEGILSHYVDSDEVIFTALAEGAVTVELRRDEGEGQYTVFARANVTVAEAESSTIEEYEGEIIIEDQYDFVVNVGDGIDIPVKPQSGQEMVFYPEGILDGGYDDGGEWYVYPIASGVCTIYINSDADEPDHTYTVKVV